MEKNKKMSFKRIYQIIYYQFLKRNYSGITAKSRVLPNFLIIGAVRCGTTSLYYDICQHPSVEKAAYDEIGFFDDNYHLGEDWYRSLFPTKKKMEKTEQNTGYAITGEDTPFYIWNNDVIKRVAEMLPNIKLISILRNPVDRAYSNYHLGIREGTEKRSFDEAVKVDMDYINSQKEKKVKLNRVDYKKSYIAKGIYSDQLKEWYEVFNKKQLCVLSTENFSNNPNETLAKVFEFLEIPNFSIKSFEKQKISDYPKMNDETRKEISKFFSEYNEKLYQMINTKFDWDS